MKYSLAVMLLGVLVAPGWAQDPGDAPEHGVARISVLQGDVTVRRGDTGELVAAEQNAPLIALDHVLTDVDSRAEVQLDWSNFVRIASESEIRLAELGDRDYLVQVAAGTVTFRVLKDSNSQLEISTPTVAIRPREAGTYRVTVRDDSSTELTIRSGEAEIFAGGRTEHIRGGQTLVISGDPSDPQRSYRSAAARDEWDRWNESRDRELERSDSYKYVNRDIYGAEDLYGYGRWVYDVPYGWVWVPTVDVGWAPYRVGRWTWVNYYGWTWVSGDPWGWAPYHYGRWYHAPRYGWVWYPGDIHARYYWRPALVTFFGWGSNVGWVSLAPYEVYRPWYGPGRTFVNHVTVVNNINVVNSYRNARFISGRSGVTSVVVNDFGRRKVSVNNYVVGNDRDYRSAGDAGRWLGREPSRENRQFSDRPVSPRMDKRPEVDRRFVSTRPDRENGRRRDDGQIQRVDLRTPRPAAVPENARTNDAPQRGVAVAPANANRGAVQQQGNRGREESPRVVASPAPENPRAAETPRRNDAVVFPRNEGQRQGNRGRNENPTVAAAPAENRQRPNTFQRNEPVAVPANEPQRERPQGNGGRNQNPIGVAAAPGGNTQRPAAVQRNEAVVFPRNDVQRERPQGNRGQNDPIGVAEVPRAEPPRRAEAPQRRVETPIGVAPTQRNEPASFPRNDSVRQADNGRGRSEGFARRENDAPRPSQAPETFRRAEPPARVEMTRPEQVQRPQVFESRPSRAPAQQSAPPPRQESRESRNNAPPPQASPAPSSQESSPGPQQGNSSGRGRGRR